uniref:ATP synthase complex subunit 8 n=1 Tax=Margarinotus merdarius TaxID=878136 RepID=A0A0S2M7P3_MARMD|nr:ATP synthase F0 subunit 8 [Margarinotus merdarius]ALO70691.1 ATP synthase F0 subunit 8 [Margarinotus merdarius]
MPQMAPLSWALLMCYFITIFLSYNILNYFVYKYPTAKGSTHMTIKKINWKW